MARSWTASHCTRWRGNSRSRITGTRRDVAHPAADRDRRTTTSRRPDRPSRPAGGGRSRPVLRTAAGPPGRGGPRWDGPREETARTKLHPDLFRMAIDRWELEPRRALAVGDSEWDIRADSLGRDLVDRTAHQRHPGGAAPRRRGRSCLPVVRSIGRSAVITRPSRVARS